jgi:hypothetical protein
MLYAFLRPYLPLCFLYLGFSCAGKTEKKALELIQNSIDFHSQDSDWDDLKGFSFEKETVLYDENGAVESQSLVLHNYRQQPFYEGQMTWVKDSVKHVFTFDGLKTSYRMGQNEIQNVGFLQSRKLDFDGTHYVISKPFDLLKGGKKVSYLGRTKLATGYEVESVQVMDANPKDSGSDDIWWYFFDPESHELVAYRVKTAGHYAEVYNIKRERFAGFLLPSRRISYRVDSIGNHLYTRAAYNYKNYKLDQ